MNINLMTSDRPVTAETRGPEVNEITRAIIAGEAVQMPVNRPQILARRMATLGSPRRARLIPIPTGARFFTS